MNILFVTYHTCARAAKEAFALMNCGHQVIILQHVSTSEDILYSSEMCVFYRDSPQSLKDRIKLLSDWADVIHVHNEPNWIVSAAVDARNANCPEVPVIFDVHDLESMRESGIVDPDETEAIHVADGFIFPSGSYESGIRGTRSIGAVPGGVIYSFCGKGDIVENPLPRVNGLVYEGGLIAPLKHYNSKTPGYKAYRDYTKLAAELESNAVPFHIYGCRPEFQESYLKVGAVVHDYHRFGVMMRQLSRYDWGLCGHMDDHPQWQKAMPNKLFEYLAAGIPVISINAGEVSEFIEKHEVGIVAKDIDELCSIARNPASRGWISEKAKKALQQFTMESQVPEIERIYADSAAYRKRRLDAGLSMRSSNKELEPAGSWVCLKEPVACA